MEILRSYSGPGEQRELPRNGDVEWEEMEHHTEMAANGSVSADSDGSDSSRDSLYSEANNSCFEALSATQDRNAVPTARQGPAGFCPTPEKPRERSHVPRQNEVRKKVLKQNAKHKKSHNHQFSSPSTRRTEEEQTCSSWDDAPYEGWSYEDYWKCYYDAWQSYYAAVSHYSRSYWQFSWMNAYQVNSVYLQELLKGGD